VIWDRDAIRAGALVALVFAIPFSVAGRVIADRDGDSTLLVWLNLGAVLGFVLGAGCAAWVQRVDAPLSHGLVTAIGPRRLGVHFDDGHRVELPDQSVRDVRLDHGYAITAHRAQGITVDRAFVLGSDELYREWGYTALSRHRDEARFYVSATPTFLNAAPAPLQADADVTRQVARMLEDSRAQHLALNGDRPDDLGRAIANELERAHERLAEVDTRLDALHDEHAQTRWYQRSRRSDIERIMASSQRSREHWQVEVARLTDQLEQRPARHEPTLWRGGDPLVAFGRLEREVSHQRDRAHDLDLGLEL